MINKNRDGYQKLEGKKVPKKGVALVTVLAIMLCLSIIAGAILILARGHYYATGSQIKHTKAYYLAEAGIQHALWECRTTGCTSRDGISNPIFTIEGIDAPITITDLGGGNYKIECKVTTEDVPAK